MAFGESNRCPYVRGPDYRGGSTVNGQILMCDSNDIISNYGNTLQHTNNDGQWVGYIIVHL